MFSHFHFYTELSVPMCLYRQWFVSATPKRIFAVPFNSLLTVNKSRPIVIYQLTSSLSSMVYLLGYFIQFVLFRLY